MPEIKSIEINTDDIIIFHFPEGIEEKDFDIKILKERFPENTFINVSGKANITVLKKGK